MAEKCYTWDDSIAMRLCGGILQNDLILLILLYPS